MDISDAFYNIELPKELRTFFALDPVRARDIGIKSCEGQAAKGSDFVFPGFKVHPMDWTHALWVCQRCHEILVDEPPNIRASHSPKAGWDTEYVDTFVSLSQKPGVAFELAEQVGTKLRSRGLPCRSW